MRGTCDVVIPHLNYEEFETGLDSLFSNTPEGVINKVFVIDQCEHQSMGHAESLPNDDRIMHIRTENLGFAKAMNTGIRLSDAPYVMCANDDIVWFNPRWWEGILSTFRDIPNALCVNPSSLQDPDGVGGKTVKEGFEYTEDMDDQTYDTLITPHVIDSICMWGPVFKRELLDKVRGIIPGKAWFDEIFYPGGSEDYDLNRRAYLSGMRCVGTGRSWVWHHWHGTKRSDGTLGAHWSKGFDEKWLGSDGEKPDLFGNTGKKEVDPITIR